MPPSLALIFCILFVFCMLRLDRKQSPEVSFALWIPTIWMLLVASKPLALWFHGSAATNEEGSPLDRAFLTILVCLGLIILTRRKFKWARLIKENIWLMLLILYILISCLWSNISFLSFKRWSREFIAVVMAFMIATEPDPRKALESLFRRMIYILIPFSFLLINYFGEYGRAYVHTQGVLMWTGVASHKNQLGQLCLVTVFYLIWTFVRRLQGRDFPATNYQTYLEALILILAFWAMGGPDHSFTYSATTTASLLTGLSVLTWLFWKKGRGVVNFNALIALIAIVIIYGTITPLIGRLSLFDVSSLLGRDQTLTGRTRVWAQLVPEVMSRPILGYGYGSFWTTDAREAYDISGAHNGYLAVMLELGFIGLILFSTFLLSSCLKARKEISQDFDWACFKICFFLMAVLHNITEASIDTFTSRIAAVMLLLAVSSTLTTYTHGGLRKS